ncbi:helix-turn-helix transcriptional regulator [Cryobacterium sp. TMS1-13-1]|uniref:helix-turn-helix domain-containing protein n=1 Tax=Cryobacterium sp. TMS1-13-1 TaxID=1259220 RepID=UPI00106DC429|nr:helix-turn-helix transcriptional regulator [Cryobacterium sp. TMS1-13-1]TFD22129.1 XRE family transcriptional regulator [Cryobacterium sp. TMS1-13-1]
MQTTDQARAEWKAWEKATTGQTVDVVNRLREAQGLTIKQLSVKLASFGWPVDLATLNGILGSKKRASLSVGEVYALARALSTTPLYLMLGFRAQGSIETGRVFDDLPLNNVDLMQWMMGSSPFADTKFLSEDMQRASDEEKTYVNTGGAVYGVFIYGNVMRAVLWQNALLVELARIEEVGIRHETLIRQARERLVSGLESILAIRFDFNEHDLAPLPPLPDALVPIEADIDLDLNEIDLPIDGLVTDDLARAARPAVRRLIESEEAMQGLKDQRARAGKGSGRVPPA